MVGKLLSYPTAGNSPRAYINGVKAGVPVTLGFTTPNLPGKLASLQVAGQIHQVLMHFTYNGHTQVSQSPIFRFVIGPDQVSTYPGGITVINRYGLQPNTFYTMSLVTDQDADVYLDFNNG
jgi:hypothetical protein